MSADNYRHFTNKQCEYYPCHKMPDGQELNCIFCYCPLYALGADCGGNYKVTPKGIKDCTDCTVCHGEGGYEHVQDKIRAVLEITREKM